MGNVLRYLFYASVGAAAYALFRFLILPAESLENWWMPAVITLGCLGAVFTITHARREDR